MTREPILGEYLIDEQGRVGRVMEFTHTWVTLRPPKGGREWDVLRDDSQPATHEQLLRALVNNANKRSRGELL
ncbi:hypothetical protein ACIQNU_14780 [Streptomyces sp. NPDC091292]|uniref:hypothetical protein n=1 Tax=Streptomyces sp. NPDC091292 TaxID=3365991 RepID=UPI0037FB8707